MLKTLAIVGLLTVVPSLHPIPRGSAKPAAQGAAQGQQNTNANKQPSPAVPQVKDQEQAGTAQTDSSAVTDQNKQQKIAVVSLPNVSLVKEKKGFWGYVFDWGPWLFDFGLVVVGILQVWLLLGTLKAIQAQARHMERQTTILEDSVAAAQKAADAALAQVEAAKSAQRAQLRIEFAEPEFTFNEELGGYPVRFQVILDGNTRAYIPEEAILAHMGQTAGEKRAAWVGTGIPRNFTPEMSPFESYTLIRKNTLPPEVDIDPGKTDLVHKHNYTVFVDGHIVYQDIFGDRWRLDIDRVWVPNSRYGGENATGGMWVPFGSGRHDTHRKVEPYKAER